MWLLAARNGSGKSTFYRTQLQPLGMPFVNADILARELYPDLPEQHSYEAARLAEQIRMQLLQEGRTFCFETVFSHPLKIDFVAQAKAFGYEIVLVFIHLDSAMLNNTRVAQWMEEDGHNVPEGKVNERFHGCWKTLNKSCLCATAFICLITRGLICHFSGSPNRSVKRLPLVSKQSRSGRNACWLTI
ncbi:AAA family ATPase [Spongiibacter sp. KMU-166]|uniref:AAA family ATPase n=1 Tax=Spongiibacter thalassae TaxID=2721624 RepID=A0ABX1GLP9_9GAMM|nr:AAA family ATPase [Spongiibacter thalassae]NKI19272.1 AAA family ATPase [Spongiibacter thalassae]